MLLMLADEMAAGARVREGNSAVAILAAHAALEAFVNETGARKIASFNLRARFLPKWHDLSERVLGRQLDSAPDLERCRRSEMRSSGTRASPNGWTAGQQPPHRRSRSI